ncbi:MAG: DUF4974 domain-containing protein, partial [Prevotella sp.]|nr:DUF4974 domain-containing protein [Prevotella sp.]
QEIRDIINHDKDTREVYRLMVEAKRSSRHRQDNESVDVNAAWKRFVENEEFATSQPTRQSYSVFRKIAASFIGMLLISGIAFAAIQIVNNIVGGEIKSPTQETRISNPRQEIVTADTLANDTVTVQPVIYDNIPLEKMLPEIAAFYDTEVIFANDEVRQLRFRFVWNPQQSIEQVIRDLNQFERLTVTLKDNQITIQ